VTTTMISTLLLRILLVPLVALWAFHLYQRRYRDAGVRKRIATLSLTVLFIALWGAAWLFSTYGIGDVYLIPVAALLVGIAIWQRPIVLPYRLRCAKCGKPLAIQRMLSCDSNACESCDPPRKEGEPIQ
jgi:hypothetical protein